MAAVAAMLGVIPLVISGDLHAIAEGRMQRSGALDFSRNPSSWFSPARSAWDTAAGPWPSVASERRHECICRWSKT
jgi:hypothetical protein